MNWVYLAIEFLDELVFGVAEAAWPAIQTDLHLTYTQIGLLMTVPALFSSMVEPFLGVLGDVWQRRLLILGGGAAFALALLLTSVSAWFGLLLFSFVLFYPASGAFVSLSQATLMDSDPSRHDQNMARWTFSGSLGVVAGPPLLVGFSWVGFGWRGAFLALAGLALLALALAWRSLPADPQMRSAWPGLQGVKEGLRGALDTLKDGSVRRWLVLLQFSDLMLDVLLGFLALYFYDVAGLTQNQAGAAVLVWLVVGLLGDFLLIPLVEKVDGLVYLRWSAAIELLLFPAFLLVPPVWLKLILVGLLGFFNSGWYAILQGRLYSSLPGKSGTVMALTNIAGLAGGILPFLIGLAADAFGLRLAIWLLLLGPLALFAGLPRPRLSRGPDPDSVAP